MESTVQQLRKQQSKQQSKQPVLTEQSKRYGAMRAWASFFYAVGLVGAVIAAVGAVILAVEVHNFWQALGLLLIAGPISVFLATFPVALSQSMNALADVAETVTGPDVGSLGDPTL
jgi:hypothetical protein